MGVRVPPGVIESQSPFRCCIARLDPRDSRIVYEDALCFWFVTKAVLSSLRDSIAISLEFGYRWIELIRTQEVKIDLQALKDEAEKENKSESEIIREALRKRLNLSSN